MSRHAFWLVDFSISLAGFVDVLKCEHERAVHLFVDSLSKDHTSYAYQCTGPDRFKKGICLSCRKNRCNNMGYNAKKMRKRRNSKMYLKTRADTPFGGTCSLYMIVFLHEYAVVFSVFNLLSFLLTLSCNLPKVTTTRWRCTCSTESSPMTLTPSSMSSSWGLTTTLLISASACKWHTKEAPWIPGSVCNWKWHFFFFIFIRWPDLISLLFTQTRKSWPELHQHVLGVCWGRHWWPPEDPAQLGRTCGVYGVPV